MACLWHSCWSDLLLCKEFKMKALLFIALSFGLSQAHAALTDFVGKYQLLSANGQNAKNECKETVEITIDRDELKVPHGFVKISLINKDQDYVSSGGGMNDRRTRWSMASTDTLVMVDRFVSKAYLPGGKEYPYDKLKIVRTLSLSNQFNTYPALAFVGETSPYRVLAVSETASSLYSNSFNCLYLKK
jgi:hypothetical protein